MLANPMRIILIIAPIARAASYARVNYFSICGHRTPVGVVVMHDNAFDLFTTKTSFAQ